MRNSMWTRQYLYACAIIVLINNLQQISANDFTHYLPPLECYDPYGRPQRCIPEFENAAFGVQMEATNTCGEEENQNFCIQTGYSNRKSCDNICSRGVHSPFYLTDIHDPHNETWWQSETMHESVQYPNQVNLTLHLGKSFDITYIRIVFYSPRPESFAIYRRQTSNGSWIPYQYYSASCRETYGLPDFLSVKKGDDETRAMCISEYSDISPLRDGNVAFSSLEGRPSAYNFENSIELQNWVTATDIRISLDRLNTFGDEVFGDPEVLKSYFYAIADVAVGARCKCNGHASKCVASTGLKGERTRVCECKHFTDGQDCEKCLPFYNDAPWGRATSKNVHECKACSCNGFSNKCFFDKNLYNLTGHGGHCLDCVANRDGPNCERCKENFYLRSDDYCSHCGCDPIGSRSLQCNSEGKCQCKPGVTGEKCDRCDVNYYDFGVHGCQPCGCDSRGSLDNTPSCDTETGVCLCKDNVEGRRCKECKPGFFSLDLENKFGCTPCFCYGHTSECQSAAGYSVVSTTSSFNKQKERWTAVDEFNRPVEIKYNQFSQSIGTTAKGNEFIYFLAPDRFLGDQRASYNRLLKFRLQLVGQVGPNPSPTDVILEGGGGNRISLPIFAQEHNMPDQEVREYAFRLHENSDYAWQPSQSSRGFISILSNLTAIKIRGTYSTLGESFLDDVELQTANRGTAGRPATWIEQCTCPEGYLGQFCESCAPGYRHSPARGGPFMPCIPCDCNKHAEICDSETGRCICQHNTAGDTCDECAKGFYGNALSGTAYDCKRCPCPENGACLQMPDESVICLECPQGYFGSRCELCSDGYYGDPTGLLGTVQLCQSCDCNGNVDPNAVGNCNRTTGECLKCIHNTDGGHCEQCLPGHFGDPLALPHGNCEQCSCYPPGTEQTNDGTSICDQLTGNCRCKANVIGRNCNECQNGYFNIVSGNGCESCNCDQIGSFNTSCERFTGQCYCKPGVTGLRCDQCEANQYGFSSEGCKPCDCDDSGSKGFQCDQYGQCPCNDNVEGRRCDRCKENKYDRHQGCLNCPDCYNLVQDAADDHRRKLNGLNEILQAIASNPTVIDDIEFESKLKTVQEKIDILAEDAKSGAGGGDRTLVERITDMHDRLTNVRNLLLESDRLGQAASHEIDAASENVSNAEQTIQDARAELTNALELLQNDGAAALAKAKDRADKFGQQSEQISEISRHARAKVEKLEKDVEQSKQNAVEANEKASKAYELAKSTLNQQQQISDELRSNIRAEIGLSKESLENAIRLTSDALERANRVYDEALTLIANVNALASPEIDLEKLKLDALNAIEDAQHLQNEIERLTSEHDKLLIEYDENSELGNTLIDRSILTQGEALRTLEHLEEINKNAKEAVALGDDTLKEANNTYHTFAGFNALVEKSSESAQLALSTVPQIENQIRDAENRVAEAEDALAGARSNAEEARRNAQEAQEKYAEQASNDAESIRRKANETKTAAHKLRGEAEHLNGRVVVTEGRIAKLNESAQKDNALTNEAKEKVGQANSDSVEAKNQVDKAIKEVKAIMDELGSLRDINVQDLDALEKRLADAENDVTRANLDERLASLDEMKNLQNKWKKNYQYEIDQLENEVRNIKLIADSLPEGCFKRARLEP